VTFERTVPTTDNIPVFKKLDIIAFLLTVCNTQLEAGSLAALRKKQMLACHENAVAHHDGWCGR
jgi:hypothetical protein